MYQLIESKLANLPKNSIILTIIPSENYNDINMFMLKHWLDKNPTHKGTYVSLNRPYQNLHSTLLNAKVDTKRLFFLDCISKESIEHENCIFIGSEYSLTNLGIALSTILKKEEFSFMFLDSLNTLAIYNGMNSTIKFTHFLITKLRTHNKDGIILGIHEDTNKKIITELSQLCDVVIDLSDKTTFT